MKPVFFYGLFMDEELLREKGFKPTSPVLAYVDNFALKIGERATLVKSQGKRAYGSIMSLSTRELDRLYGEGSVADYTPEDIVAMNYENEPLSVVSYNLPLDKLKGKNAQYAVSLVTVAKKVGLPADYIVEIEQWAH